MGATSFSGAILQESLVALKVKPEEAMITGV
jgi:hypothetical protein